MDDNASQRTLKIKVGETEYPAAPFGQAQIMALQMIKGVQGATVIKILSGLVKFSLGEDAQSDVLVMLAQGDIDEHGLIKVLMDVATETAKAKEAEKEALADVARRVPVQSLDEESGPVVPKTFTGLAKPGAY